MINVFFGALVGGLGMVALTFVLGGIVWMLCLLFGPHRASYWEIMATIYGLPK